MLGIAAGFVFAAATATGMSAGAYCIKEIKAPEGYTEITESTGYTQIDGDTQSFFLKENENGTADAVKYEFFKHNYTVLEIPNDKVSVFDEICEKYVDKLNMSEILRTKDCIDFSSPTQEKYMEVVMFDFFTVDGKILKDASAGENKYELIKEMIDELYSADSLIKAEYKGSVADSVTGRYDGNTNITTDDSVSQEEIDNLLSCVCGKSVDSWHNEKTGTIRYTYEITLSRLSELKEAVTSEYPEVSVIPRLVFEANTSVVDSGNINMLDPYVCDIDDSGNADISDASQILKNYSENAAGIQKASAGDKMDVNGDGAVNIDDASYVLRYYAESSANLR